MKSTLLIFIQLVKYPLKLRMNFILPMTSQNFVRSYWNIFPFNSKTLPFIRKNCAFHKKEMDILISVGYWSVWCNPLAQYTNQIIITSFKSQWSKLYIVMTVIWISSEFAFNRNSYWCLLTPWRYVVQLTTTIMNE